MKFEQLQALTEDILLVIYDRSARFSHQDWDLESAFRAIGRDDFQETGSAVLNRLVERGWATSHSIQGTRLQGDKFAVSLTDLGRFAAIRILEASEPKSALQKLHTMHWATWGGLAAIMAALASLLAAIFAYKALP